MSRGAVAAALFAATAFFAPGLHAADCSGSAADCIQINLTVDGRGRLYQYHLPQGQNCTTPLPLVMFLHGGGGTANGVRANVGYAASDRNCYVVAFPQGVLLPGGGVWSNGNCIGLPAQSGYTGPQTAQGCGYGLEEAGVNDITYFNAVLDDLRHHVSYDERHVYAAGWSHGGGMAHRLACELSNRITAIAPIEGTIKIAQCHPPRAVPMIEWATLGDTTSPFAGGDGDTSVPYSVSVRLAVSQLPAFGAPTSTYSTNHPIHPSVTDFVRLWMGGKDGSSVILHTLSAQLEHDWLFDEPPAFDWQELDWTFFQQYALPAHTNRRRAVRR